MVQLVQNCPKWSKIVKKKWSKIGKMVQNGQTDLNMSEMVKNSPNGYNGPNWSKWSNMIKDGQKWSKRFKIVKNCKGLQLEVGPGGAPDF